MAKDYNRFTFTGRLGRDPEERQAGTGKVVSFSVACDRPSKGETKTDWFNVQCWDKLGDLALTYLHKGSRVHIEGTVQIREYKDTGGITKTAIDIVCRDFMMLDSRPAATREDSDGNAIADEPLPF